MGGTLTPGAVGVRGRPFWESWQVQGASGVRDRAFVGGTAGSWEAVGVRGRPFLGIVTGPGGVGSP